MGHALLRYYKDHISPKKSSLKSQPEDSQDTISELPSIRTQKCGIPHIRSPAWDSPQELYESLLRLSARRGTASPRPFEMAEMTKPTPESKNQGPFKGPSVGYKLATALLLL